MSPRNMVALLLLMLFCIGVRSDDASGGRNAARMAHLPRRILWVWERPEDLRAIDATTTGIAYLDQTILISDTAEGRHRAQSMAYPTGATLISIARIEAPPNAVLNTEIEKQAVNLLLRSARRPGIAAFQVDFDATRSQRVFYRRLLGDLREQMPPDLPLSITALASWCSYDDWIGTLPVDEAVPMFFRMEPDRRRASTGLPAFHIREPLCMRSVGVSTHEPWPPEAAQAKRVYIFPDRGWSNDLASLEPERLP
jgi:hypothetical protein